MTPAFGALNSDVDLLETYEDIYSIESYTSFNWNTFAQPGYTRVITFTPPSDGTYKFEITSEFDTYIYVLDPRSYEMIEKGIDDDDDDDGDVLNALLEIELEEDVPYLIIYSAYNPNSLSEQKDLTLKISKN